MKTNSKTEMKRIKIVFCVTDDASLGFEVDAVSHLSFYISADFVLVRVELDRSGSLVVYSLYSTEFEIILMTKVANVLENLTFLVEFQR